MSTTFAIIQADGTTIAYPASPQRNLQPTGGGTVADAPQYTAATVGAGGPHPMAGNIRVMLVNSNAGVSTVQLPDPRTAGANLPNGYVAYVVNFDNAGGGNNVTVEGASGGNLMDGTKPVIAGAGSPDPQTNGASFMVVDNTNQDGWLKATL